MINIKVVYDDIIYSLQRSGGISVYWKELENRIKVYKRLIYRNAKDNIFYVDRNNSEYKKTGVLFERYRPLKLKENDFFIFHSSYYRYCNNKFARNINTVHDFTYELYRKDFKSLIHKIQKRNAIMKSHGVICISNNTKNDLKKNYPDYKGLIKVIYHGYDDATFKVLDNFKKTKNVLFIGSRVSYKRFDFTVKLLAQFPTLNLLIIGGGQLSLAEMELLDKNIPNRYEVKGFVTDSELASLYNNAFALLYPSDYEGFGFPVIEAQACGCPVICQNKSSIPEVSGDICVYVNPNDITRSVNEICKLFNSDVYDKMRRDGLENVKRFSWENCIQETLDFYNECFEKGNR